MQTEESKKIREQIQDALKGSKIGRKKLQVLTEKADELRELGYTVEDEVKELLREHLDNGGALDSFPDALKKHGEFVMSRLKKKARKQLPSEYPSVAIADEKLEILL